MPPEANLFFHITIWIKSSTHVIHVQLVEESSHAFRMEHGQLACLHVQVIRLWLASENIMSLVIMVFCHNDKLQNNLCCNSQLKTVVLMISVSVDQQSDK